MGAGVVAELSEAALSAEIYPGMRPCALLPFSPFFRASHPFVLCVSLSLLESRCQYPFVLLVPRHAAMRPTLCLSRAQASQASDDGS
jgi:hypothetical protein